MSHLRISGRVHSLIARELGRIFGSCHCLYCGWYGKLGNNYSRKLTLSFMTFLEVFSIGTSNNFNIDLCIFLCIFISYFAATLPIFSNLCTARIYKDGSFNSFLGLYEVRISEFRSFDDRGFLSTDSCYF
jgi:hypothetical protein